MTYSATYTYSVAPYEGGIVTFKTSEELDQWYEAIGQYCYSVIFH